MTLSTNFYLHCHFNRESILFWFYDAMNSTCCVLFSKYVDHNENYKKYYIRFCRFMCVPEYLTHLVNLIFSLHEINKCKNICKPVYDFTNVPKLSESLMIAFSVLLYNQMDV